MRFLIAVICLAACALGVCDDSAWERVPGMLRPIKGKMELDFGLVRHFKDMDYDMEGKGTIRIVPGKELVFCTETPMKATCTISPTQLVVNDGGTGRTTTIKADKQPFIARIFQLQDSWFKGDFSGFKEELDVAVQDASTLHLTPRNPKLKAFAKAVHVQINPDTRHISSIVLEEPTGDSITITFANIRE